METTELETLCRELLELIDHGADSNPSAMATVRQIAGRIGLATDDPYVNECRSAVVAHFEIWFSARRWHRWSKDPLRARSVVRSSVSRLERALRSLPRRNASTRDKPPEK